MTELRRFIRTLGVVFALGVIPGGCAGITAGQVAVSVGSAVLSRMPLEEKFPILRLEDFPTSKPKKSPTRQPLAAREGQAFAGCVSEILKAPTRPERDKWAKWCTSRTDNRGRRQKIGALVVIMEARDGNWRGYRRAVARLDDTPLFVTLHGERVDLVHRMRGLAEGDREAIATLLASDS